LLLKIADEGDNEGWVETRQLASALGAPDEEKINGVGVRLGWMRRFGMLEHDDKTKMWRLSPGGDRVTQARLKAAKARTIEAVPDEALIDVMAHVTTRYRLGDPILATMLRREFQFGTDPRSRAYGNGR
jgi:hypothetical protein